MLIFYGLTTYQDGSVRGRTFKTTDFKRICSPTAMFTLSFTWYGTSEQLKFAGFPEVLIIACNLFRLQRTTVLLQLTSTQDKDQ